MSPLESLAQDVSASKTSVNQFSEKNVTLSGSLDKVNTSVSSLKTNLVGSVTTVSAKD